MDMGYYILEPDHTFRKAATNEEYYAWAKNEAVKRIGATWINDKVWVSTVFLGLDHSYDGTTPILFETMIFGGEHDQFQDRYYSWQEAVEGHLKAIDMAREAVKTTV